MKYKVYFCLKTGRITECLCDTVDDCIKVAKQFGQCDVYEYQPKTDSYDYKMSVEVL